MPWVDNSIIWQGEKFILDRALQYAKVTIRKISPTNRAVKRVSPAMRALAEA